MDKPREIGILFRGDMIRAILAGQKTETRRPIRWPSWADTEINRAKMLAQEPPTGLAVYKDGRPVRRWPVRGAPGDRLWVRETWTIPGLDFSAPGADPERADRSLLRYRADGERVQVPWLAPGDLVKPTWRPPLLMPRWACRITLPVFSVRAERLTDITDAGAVAEGFVHAGLGATAADYCREYRRMYGLDEDADPWVWVVGFGAAEVTNA